MSRVPSPDSSAPRVQGGQPLVSPDSWETTVTGATWGGQTPDTAWVVVSQFSDKEAQKTGHTPRPHVCCHPPRCQV